MKTSQSACRRWIHTYGLGALFYMPFFILFLIFTIIPVFIGMGMSFTNYDMLRAPEFLGLDNYKNLFIFDENFSKALINTFVIGGIAGPVGYLASFLFAWILNNLRFKRLFTVILYAPSVAGGMGIMWDYLFSADRYGLINNILINIGLINSPIIWSADTDYIVPINILIIVWGSMGTGFLVFLAGLQNLDPQMAEAGRIDGIRNAFQELWFIILPQVKPQLLYGAISTIVASVGIFPSFGGFPSPNYVAHTLAAHIQDYGFVRFELGYASAICMVMFFLSFGLGQVVIRLLGEHDRKIRKPKAVKRRR